MDSPERIDLLRSRVVQPVGEGQLAEVDLEGRAPDREPLDVLQGLAAGEGENEVLVAVGLEVRKRPNENMVLLSCINCYGATKSEGNEAASQG